MYQLNKNKIKSVLKFHKNINLDDYNDLVDRCISEGMSTEYIQRKLLFIVARDLKKDKKVNE